MLIDGENHRRKEMLMPIAGKKHAKESAGGRSTAKVGLMGHRLVGGNEGMNVFGRRYR